jgi:hypothetical protein
MTLTFFKELADRDLESLPSLLLIKKANKLAVDSLVRVL